MVKEWIEIELSMFSAVLLLVLGRVITVEEAFSGFSNEGMLTIGLMFILAGSLYYSGLISHLSVFIFGRNGSSSIYKMMRILFPVAGISAFMNNTPIVAVLIPALRNWAEQNRLSLSKFLIPVSYAAILGGMCTLIGTSTNLIIYGLMIDSGIEGLGMFEMTKIAVPVMLIGLLYILIMRNSLLPERMEYIQDFKEHSREFVVVLKISDDYKGIGKSIQEAGLRHLQGLFLFQIERKGKIIAPAAPNEIMELGDRLFFTGIPKTILELQKTAGLVVMEDEQFDLKQYDSSQIRPFEVVISPSSPLIGKNIRRSNFREKYDAVIIAIHRNGERIKKKIGDIELKAGDTLLILTKLGFHRRWYNSIDFYLISESDEVPSKAQWRTFAAPGILIMVILLSALKIMPILMAEGLGVMILLLTKTISMEEVRKSIDFRVLIIIASAFGLAHGLTNSGVAEYAANIIIEYGSYFGTIGIMISLFITASVYTNFMTNNAAAAILFPIVLSMSQQLQINTRALIIALVLAVSASFSTPIGYQTNLMIYGPGGYRFTDFLKFGIPLQLIFIIISIALLYLFYL
ncbi:MAG: anion permease [Calditrichaceae bacterium]|nr:anion permease [Calditrichaceae bacterium]RQV94033.1 MAG: SLC13 family permease [Calditrichota bacterium]